MTHESKSPETGMDRHISTSNTVTTPCTLDVINSSMAAHMTFSNRVHNAFYEFYLYWIHDKYSHFRLSLNESTCSIQLKTSLA